MARLSAGREFAPAHTDSGTDSYSDGDTDANADADTGLFAGKRQAGSVNRSLGGDGVEKRSLLSVTATGRATSKQGGGPTDCRADLISNPRYTP